MNVKYSYAMIRDLVQYLLGKGIYAGMAKKPTLQVQFVMSIKMGTLDVVSLVFSIVGFSGSFSWYGEETCKTGRICH